jgi:hypothetical protein
MMVREAASQRGPIMAMKVEALAREELLHELRSTLPDFLSSTSGRTPIPRARWKELWVPEPKSIQALERQLVKLVEQALWAMVQDPAFSVPVIEEDNPLVDALAGDMVPFQDWMECDVNPKSGDPSSKKKKKQKKVNEERAAKGKRKTSTPSTPSVVSKQDIGSLPDYDDGGDDDEDLASVSERASQSSMRKEEAHLKDWMLYDVPELVDPLKDLVAQTPTAEGSELQANSDDESVGVSLFTQESGTSTHCATGASSPVLTQRPAPRHRHLPSIALPPPSPSGAQRILHPPSLVCYIWNQTSRFDHGAESHQAEAQPPTSPCADTTSGTPQTSSCGTPFARRGQWMRPQGPSSSHSSSPYVAAVVRNTFVDIRETEEPAPQHCRPARSLSPSWGSLCDQHWYEDGWP